MNRVGRRSGADGPDRRSASGQATAEFALLLPLLALVGLAVVQVALVADTRVQLTHAARAGARVASIGGNDSLVRQAVESSGNFDGSSVHVSVQRTTRSVEVTVSYQMQTDVPIVGRLVDDVRMVAVAQMPREPP